MVNSSDFSNGWVIPGDLERLVNGTLSRESITPEQEFQYALDKIARDITLIDSVYQDFGW